MVDRLDLLRRQIGSVEEDPEVSPLYIAELNGGVRRHACELLGKDLRGKEFASAPNEKLRMYGVLGYLNRLGLPILERNAVDFADAMIAIGDETYARILSHLVAANLDFRHGFKMGIDHLALGTEPDSAPDGIRFVVNKGSFIDTDLRLSTDNYRRLFGSHEVAQELETDHSGQESLRNLGRRLMYEPKSPDGPVFPFQTRSSVIGGVDLLAAYTAEVWRRMTPDHKSPQVIPFKM
jgi:hypothetical protein